MTPPQSYIFDIETDGLLNDVTKIHCIALKDLHKIDAELYHGESLAEGIDKIRNASMLIGHNISKYDIPVLEKLVPGFKLKDDCKVRDTLLIAQMLFPEEQGQSLDAWGERLGELKGVYTSGWEEYNEEMGEYCLQDVNVTIDLYYHILMTIKKEELRLFFDEAYKTEIDIVPILNRQHNRGIDFDIGKANLLNYTLVVEKFELDEKLKEAFPIRYINKGIKTPAKNRGAYTQGASYSVIASEEFNPGSRQQIIDRLNKKYGWVSPNKTDKGNASIDQSVLAALPYPEAQLLHDRLEIDKRLGQLSEGAQAWSKLVSPDGRIHGEFHQCGTVTRRFTHFKPNMSQVPAVGKPYGKECRELFYAPRGYKMVGIDASQLEMRCLAGYIKAFDKGSLEFDLVQGDMHKTNANILGCTRDQAKVFFYALVYGAGDYKLSSIVPGKKRVDLISNLPGMEMLLGQLKDTWKKRGYLMSLDGCPLRIRSEHALLNTLLQSAGSIIMKRALKIFDDMLQERGYIVGDDYEFVNNIHDEWQLVVKEEHADTAGMIGIDAIKAGGVSLKFPTPMDGEYKIGNDWSQTH